MRMQNSIRNLSAAWISQLVMLIVKFTARTIFVIYLNEEYLGLNGLFSNILSMLSLAELGVGTAIVFSLYKPIALNNQTEIKAIMRLFKKLYIGIGCFILIAGCSLTPFLNVFIKEMPKNIPNINLIYILFVINSSISYFYSYKSSFIIANQKNYVTTINHIIYYTITNIAQIIILIFTKSFVLFLILQIIMTFLENFTISRIANKMYPILKENTNIKLNPKTKNEIIKNTGAMVFHKVGTIIVFSTDNLVLSKMVGLISVGVYSNYSMIIAAIDGILTQMFSAITASVGNLRVTTTIEKQLDVFYTTFFVNFCLYSYCTICLFNILNPFINLWFGDKYLFGYEITIVLALNFYMTGMRKSTLTFKDAFGLFWQNRYMPLFEALINLLFSIILTYFFGIIGVFLGTGISTVLTCMWIEPLVLFRYGFKQNCYQYFLTYMKYLIVLFCMSVSSYLLNSLIVWEGLLGIIIIGIICTITCFLFIFIFFGRTKEFHTIYIYITRFIHRKSKI